MNCSTDFSFEREVRPAERARDPFALQPFPDMRQVAR